MTDVWAVGQLKIGGGNTNQGVEYCWPSWKFPTSVFGRRDQNSRTITPPLLPTCVKVKVTIIKAISAVESAAEGGKKT